MKKIQHVFSSDNNFIFILKTKRRQQKINVILFYLYNNKKEWNEYEKKIL